MLLATRSQSTPLSVVVELLFRFSDSGEKETSQKKAILPLHTLQDKISLAVIFFKPFHLPIDTDTAKTMSISKMNIGDLLPANFVPPDDVAVLGRGEYNSPFHVV